MSENVISLMKIDFHVHTSASMGKNTTAEMVAIAKKRGLDAIAITDRETLKGWKNFKPSNFTIIPGVELLTDKGLVLIYGIQKLPEKRELDFIIDWAKDWNYLVVPAHFMDKKKESLGESALESFKIVEAINGNSSAGFCKEAVTLCTSSGVKFMSNSGAKQVRDLGEFYNNVEIDSTEWQDIMSVVEKGEFSPRVKFPRLLKSIKSSFF